MLTQLALLVSLLTIILREAICLKVGVAKVDATLPVGVPLAGYGERRVPDWPLAKETKYTTWMLPSTGHLTPTWVKALVIDTGDEQICFVTVDAIGSDGTLAELAYDIATSKGFRIPFDNVAMFGSHSHSGPGAITPEFLWAVVPATDLLVPELQEMFATSIANAMLQAQENLQDGTMGIDIAQLKGVTRNRRAGVSPYLHEDDIDPNLGVISVNDGDGKPLATVWNYAIHGTCWGSSQLLSNGDIMGGVNDVLETMNSGVAMFINADAGDISPGGDTCSGEPNFQGAPVIAKAVMDARNNTKMSDNVEIRVATQVVPFGETNLNLTFARVENCTSGGPVDICSICKVLNCDVNLHLNEAWVEQNPKFGAFAFNIDGTNTGMVTIPGEALSDLGTEIRNDLLNMKFDNVLLGGYSNNHMGYFATEREYDVGGYESLLTFWGVDTAERIRTNCTLVAKKVAP
ncbi:neutral ceramidase B-like [Dysidea avara]|uniref:neutral ceramidase B-like n=1 Tax=Dysidea avara TaxID=196820 RepID=UPI00332EA83B